MLRSHPVDVTSHVIVYISVLRWCRLLLFAAADFVIIIVISFMQGIHTYIPETNHVPREYSVAAILS